MESPSDPAHRGCVPWQGLMLTASLLTFWSLATTAKIAIESVPPNVFKGDDVLLNVHNMPGNLGAYTWYKGKYMSPEFLILLYVIETKKSHSGPAYSHRETVYPNGSLLFRNVTMRDTAYYSIECTTTSFSRSHGTGYIRVYSSIPKPSIISTRSNPEEHKDPVILMCDSQTRNINYQWLFNKKSLPASARLKLSMDNKTLTLISVTRNDAGFYECEIQNPASANRSDPFTLNVLYGPDPPTISPSDSYYLRGAKMQLSCHAASNPPAQFSWLINGISKAINRYLYIPNITLKNSGSYTCLAHNSVTDLKRTTIKTITVYEPVGKPSLQAGNGTIRENMDAVNLTCLTKDTDISTRWLFKNQQLLLTDRMNLSRDNSTLTIDPVRRENAGDYQCEVFNPASSRKSDPLRLEVQYNSTLSPRLSEGSVPGVMIGGLAGVAVIAALMYFMYSRKTAGASDQRDLRT